MAAETQYTANTGMANIATANSNLDGTGTLGTVLTGASNGTLIKTVNVKAIVNTTQGMVRLFIYDGANTKLIHELQIPAVTKSANDIAFEASIPLNFYLKSGWVLKASTEKAETFNVIAEGLNWAYYVSSVRSDTTKNEVVTSGANPATANTNLDGTGAIVALDTAGGNGINILSVSIKSIVNTTDGMVRLFIHDGTNARLFREVPVSAVTKSAIASSFEYKVRFPDGFALKSGWSLRASTEKSEMFHVVADTLQWTYPA